MSDVSMWFDKMRDAIEAKAEAALAMNEIYQFNITGEGGGTWTINLKEGPSVTESAHDDATCIITLTKEDFLALMNEETTGMELFASGRLQLERDAMAAMKLEQLFAM